MFRILIITAVLLFSYDTTGQFIYDTIGKYGDPKTQKSTLSRIEPNPLWAPFYHGVASGDPGETRIIIWTRITVENMDDSPIDVEWRVATDPDLFNIVQQGVSQAKSSQDFTVKVDVEGLLPGNVYYYGFSALGANSLTGRTKTLPESSMTDHIKFAVMVCSNFQSGYFNAYRQVGLLNDLDAVIHLGDYIYEYGNGGLADTNLLEARPIEPDHELITLEDYRARYATYRLDTNCIRAHQQHPFIAVWDDHEIANNAWRNGAENHTESTEGPWSERKLAGRQAYMEWLPIRDTPEQKLYRSFSFGDLVDLIMLDTRHEGRDQQVESSLDIELQNPDRSMLGSDQREWLYSTLLNANAKWKIIGNQVLISPLNAGWLTVLLPEMDFWGYESLFLDTWSGYPSERQNLLEYISHNKIQNIVFATGDLHVAFAVDIPLVPNEFELVDSLTFTQIPIYSETDSYDPISGDGSIAVEFMTPSITAPNFDESYDQLTALVLESTMNAEIALNNGELVVGNPNPHYKYLDLTNHGYMILNITPALTQADWYHVPLAEPSDEYYLDESWLTYDLENKLRNASGPFPPKELQDIPAPLNPPLVSSIFESLDIPGSSNIILYPNPTRHQIHLQIELAKEIPLSFNLQGINGLITQSWKKKVLGPDVHELTFQMNSTPPGIYVFQIISEGSSQCFRLVVLDK